MNSFSPTPKEIACPHCKEGAGCCVLGPRDFPPVYAEAQQFFKGLGLLALPLHRGNPVGWRLRSKLAIRGDRERPLIGLYKEGTHDLVEIPHCPMHHPKINLAVQYLKEFIQKAKLDPYDEKTGSGDLRYVQLDVQRSTQKVQLSVVSKERCPQIAELWELQPDFWHSLWNNVNTRRDNVIFGTEWQHLAGEKYLWETLLDVPVAYLPASFKQANLDLFEKMLETIPRHLSPTSKVVEYYAGSGVIGLTLARYCQSIICSEINPQSQECFEVSRKNLPPQDAQKLSFVTGSTDQLLNLLKQGDVIIVDPPRKGLEKSLVAALKNPSQSKTLIYISCGWNSFQRDCLSLLEGGWKLPAAEAYLFFPGTNHLETLAVFVAK